MNFSHWRLKVSCEPHNCFMQNKAQNGMFVQAMKIKFNRACEMDSFPVSMASHGCNGKLSSRFCSDIKQTRVDDGEKDLTRCCGGIPRIAFPSHMARHDCIKAGAKLVEMVGCHVLILNVCIPRLVKSTRIFFCSAVFPDVVNGIARGNVGEFMTLS